MNEEKLSLSNKVVFWEKENYEYHKSKESLTLEINNFEKESYREKVSPKKNKKAKEATWSDSKSSDSKSVNENKNNQNDYIAFVTFVNFEYDINGKCEFNDHENASVLENVIDKFQHLIQSHVKLTIAYESQKSYIGMLNEEKIKLYWEKSISRN